MVKVVTWYFDFVHDGQLLSKRVSESALGRIWTLPKFTPKFLAPVGSTSITQPCSEYELDTCSIGLENLLF